MDQDKKTMNKMSEINTVQKFLDATGFNRGKNYPSIKLLKQEMKKLKLDKDVMIDVMSFFLYDHESE